MLAFLHIPKTGGSTVRSILRRNFFLRHFDVYPLGNESDPIQPRDLRWARLVHPGGRAMSSHWFRGDTDFAGAGIEADLFTILRDPVELSVSWYQFRLRKGRDALDRDAFFSRRGLANLQTRRIAGEVNLQRAIDLIEERFAMVGLQRRFDESLILLRDALPAYDLDVRYQVRNRSENRTVEKELFADTNFIDALRERNETDFALCRYVEERFFPHPITSPAALEFPDGKGSLKAAVVRFRTKNYSKPMRGLGCRWYRKEIEEEAAARVRRR